VPLDALERHTWIYDSDYYRGLLKKAKLTNPTELVSSGESHTLQHACIARSLLTCKLLESYYFPNVLERTNGQIKMEVSSLYELGLHGTDTLTLVSEGTLGMMHVYAGYIAGELPQIEIQGLWGVFASMEDNYEAITAITPETDAMVEAATDGSKVINHNWFAGIDQYFYCNKKFESLADFKGQKTRSHSAALTDWIEGMGAESMFISFSETYVALEQGIMDCAVTGPDPGWGQRYFEVTDYMNGPLVSFVHTNNVINQTLWEGIPLDLQQIMIEEGAKSELEALRIASIQNEVGLEKNIREGMEVVPFTDEMLDHSFNVALLQHVIPGWLRRMPENDPYEVVALFNKKVGPIVGLYIEEDGSVTVVETKR